MYDCESIFISYVFSQLDTPLTAGVFVFIMKRGHTLAALSLFV